MTSVDAIIDLKIIWRTKVDDLDLFISFYHICRITYNDYMFNLLLTLHSGEYLDVHVHESHHVVMLYAFMSIVSDTKHTICLYLSNRFKVI